MLQKEYSCTVSLVVATFVKDRVTTQQPLDCLHRKFNGSK